MTRRLGTPAPWWPREAARWALPVAGLCVALLVAGTFQAWRGWQHARDDAVRPLQLAPMVANAAAGDASCGGTATAAAPMVLPEPATVLADLQRAPASAEAQLADLRFERTPATAGTLAQLQVSGTLQGSYAAGKQALKGVLERYPGAVLGSLRVQRPSPSAADVQWLFTLQFSALPTYVGGGPPCARPPVQSAAASAVSS